MTQGTIIRVAGPVVDVQFTEGKLPALQEALTVTAEGTERTMEVTQHVNETTVRCIMLSASEGLGKGMTVNALGHGLTAPVGEATLGRMFDPLGRPIDGKGPMAADVPTWPIHRKAPGFEDQKPATEILETGIKVIDLLAPYAKGGKIGLFGGAGVGKTVLIQALIREHIQPDMKLMKWCSEVGVGGEENLMVPLRFMTPHKLMRYAAEQFAAHKKTSFMTPGYYSMSDLLTDYKDYLCMSEALDYDMKSEFILFPRDLKEAHDRVNDLSDKELSAAYDRKIAKAFAELQSRYQFRAGGLMIVPPRSAKEIVKEGQKLHHCVGRYVKDVVKSK